MRWWTADLHFGHANIIRYTERPFGDVEEMDAGIIDRWNATVRPDDEVWVLGDFALGRISETLPLVHELHGRVTLVPGNHDRPWIGHHKGAAKWTASYLDAGFDAVVQGPVPVEIGGTHALAHHFPYAGDSHGDDRYAEHRPADRGRWLLHGHVHTQWRQAGRQINVGADAWGGRPVSDDELVALIAAGPADLALIPWGQG
jgi:calcineurin-like phosphoesterase family protein